jgi:hypothetical protein
MTPAMAFEEDESVMNEMAVSKEIVDDWMPVNEEVLDGMRGGFQSSPNGPMMSFGIERSVFLNDKLVSSTVLDIPDVSRFAANPSHAFTLIQHGSGNSVPQNLSSLSPFMTVIQNSLDHQSIQTHTVINATVAALSLGRSLELGNALSQATVDALRH